MFQEFLAAATATLLLKVNDATTQTEGGVDSTTQTDFGFEPITQIDQGVAPTTHAVSTDAVHPPMKKAKVSHTGPCKEVHVRALINNQYKFFTFSNQAFLTNYDSMMSDFSNEIEQGKDKDIIQKQKEAIEQEYENVNLFESSDVQSSKDNLFDVFLFFSYRNPSGVRTNGFGMYAVNDQKKQICIYIPKKNISNKDKYMDVVITEEIDVYNKGIRAFPCKAYKLHDSISRDQPVNYEMYKRYEC